MKKLDNRIVNRMNIMFFLFLLFSFFLIGKIFYLQNFEVDEKTRNTIEAVKNIEVESPRGNIYSDNGDLLVSTVIKYELRWDSKIPSELVYNKDINSLTNNSWVKLTHSQSPESSIKNKIETYQLESIDFEIDIEKKKYFYWMSSSAFKASIDKYPKIIEKYHFCGPGNTYNEISKILGNDKNLFVELSYDSWKKKLLQA